NKNASPRATAASLSRKLSHSPANTRGGMERRRSTTESRSATSSYTGCCFAPMLCRVSRDGTVTRLVYAIDLRGPISRSLAPIYWAALLDLPADGLRDYYRPNTRRWVRCTIHDKLCRKPTSNCQARPAHHVVG